MGFRRPARMRAGRRATCVLAAAAIALATAAPPADANRMGSATLAAVQVALRARGFYDGTVDGISGPATRSAVRSLQRRNGLVTDGIAGPQTLRALGRRGRPRLGRRVMERGDSGFDV